MVAIPKPEHSTVREIDRAREAAQEVGFRPHLGASILGRKCVRALWYSFRWCTPARFPGRVLRIFERGQLEENLLAGDLRRAGVTLHTVDDETGGQFRFSDIGGHVGGSMDGCALGLVEAPKTWHVWEAKTHNDKSFKELEKKGVKDAKPEHEAQMQLYMLWSGMTRTAYTALNKNDSTIYIERVKADPVAAAKLVEKGREVVTASEPLSKVSDKGPSYYLCKWCDHADVCHHGKLPPANCRTCAHATAELDGDARWSCAWHKRDLDVPAQRAGCPDHVYIPALTPWACVDGNDAENWAEYRMGDGRQFRNGNRANNAIPSSELYAAQEAGGSVDVLFDSGVAALREQFDGEVVLA